MKYQTKNYRAPEVETQFLCSEQGFAASDSIEKMVVGDYIDGDEMFN